MLVDELKAFMQGDVAADSATLEKFSRDYSVFKVKPSVVVFPRDVEDVKKLVKFVAAKKAKGEPISLTGRSASPGTAARSTPRIPSSWPPARRRVGSGCRRNRSSRALA